MASVVERSAGLFARKVIARYEGYPIEENERLRNNHIRHHFLTKLYAFATCRTIKEGNSQEDLVKFHKNNYFLFNSYNSIISNKISELLTQDIENEQMFMEYSSFLKQTMKKPGKLASRIGAARDNFSNFNDVTPSEISFLRIFWKGSIKTK